MSAELDELIGRCLRRDRSWLRKRLRRLQDTQDDASERQLAADIQRSVAIVEQRRQQSPDVALAAGLPISERAEEIAELIQRHQVVVVCGETGSGKSTQLPKLCLKLGHGIYGRIGHTQPRRIAARSLASRIASELDEALGGVVGYKVRFRDHVADETRIKLMTDGILLAEIQRDRDLKEYDTLIIDEAHERSLNIDFLLGYLHRVLHRRRDLKLIITSATIDPQRFSRHFDSAPIVEVSGRTFPVEVRYRPPQEPGAGERDESMQQAIVDAIVELQGEGGGDILVFLSGEREIRETDATLRRHRLDHSEVIPLYARLSPAEQAKVFRPGGRRRIVLATNVAETSLTVPGIRYVIDAGFARISRYSARSRIQRLPVERISQASAEQRKGRCGRVADGICIRLYDEDDLAGRDEYTEPEIQRTNLAAVILQMSTLGFGDVARFPFVDPPDGRLVRDGFKLLEELAAVDGKQRVTALGRRLARLPVDPRVGRMLIAAADSGCLRETLVIAAALSVQDPRDRPADKRQSADEAHAMFADERSDFVAWLKLWSFLEEQRRHLSRRKFEALCRQHFLSPTRVREWHDVHVQLRLQMHELGYRENEQDAGYAPLHRALLHGLLSHIGVRDQGKAADYLGARNRRFFLFPGSGLFAKRPKWVMAAELVETTRLYARGVAAIEPGWIEPIAGHLIRKHHSAPRWQGRRGQVAADEKVTLYGLPIVPRRTVNYGPIDPVVSRELFIRFGLTEGDMHSRAPFWRHNQQLLADLHDLEAKARRRDILVDEEVLYAFFDKRIPDGIYSVAALERWLRGRPQRERKVLHLRREDLVRPGAPVTDEDSFPDWLDINGTRLPLSYRFEPGEAGDGVTVDAPPEVLGQISDGLADRLVPGLLREKVTRLIKGLPKGLRRSFVPVPEVVEKILGRLPASDQPLVRALGAELKALTAVQVPETAWDEAGLPDHLRMRVRVVNVDNGKVLDEGRELAVLRQRWADRPTMSAGWRKTQGEALTDWTCGALEEGVSRRQGRLEVRAYPALVDKEGQVSVALIDNLPAARVAHRAGLRRLLLARETKWVRQLKRQWAPDQGLALQYAQVPPHPYAPITAAAALFDDMLALACDLALRVEPWQVRDAEAFERARVQLRQGLGEALAGVAGLVAEILAIAHDVRRLIRERRRPNWQRSVDDAQNQLDCLVFQGFLRVIPESRLRDYPRYLQAMQRRLEKLERAARRDSEQLDQLAKLQASWLERDRSRSRQGGVDDRLDEIRWLLEELRVSLFAQELKTKSPVSIKRIQRRWDELGL